MVVTKGRYWVLCELLARTPVLYRIREGFQEGTTFKLSLEGYLGVHQELEDVPGWGKTQMQGWYGSLGRLNMVLDGQSLQLQQETRQDRRDKAGSCWGF